LTTEISFSTSYPAPALWPNKRPHWSKKARSVKLQRLAVQLDALAILPRGFLPLSRAELLFTLHCPGATRAQLPDPDNVIAALKSTIDGLVDAKILTDDRDVSITLQKMLPRREWFPKQPEHKRHCIEAPYLSRLFVTIRNAAETLPMVRTNPN
jgi:hypothetical protein